MEFDSRVYEQFAEIGEEIGKRLDRASTLYNDLIKAGGVPMSDENLLHTGTISNFLDDLDDGIVISWETTWSHGGHDQGVSFYAVEDLLDDTWEESITKRATESIEFHRIRIEKRENSEEKIDRARYEALKKKFEK